MFRTCLMEFHIPIAKPMSMQTRPWHAFTITISRINTLPYWQFNSLTRGESRLTFEYQKQPADHEFP